MLNLQTAPWWQTDEYDDPSLLSHLSNPDLWGPNGIALVKAYESGATQAGWGLVSSDGSAGFMERYMRNEFRENRVIYGYTREAFGAALIMRASRLVCIDIDGKNGGFDYVKDLGLLPPTLAERSKSGNGYHLFYTLPDTWDPVKGFDMIRDQVGIVKGVDIRATGCVYHWHQQRWNDRAVHEAPAWLIQRLTRNQSYSEARSNKVQNTLASQDETEILLMQDELVAQLNRTIPAGRRNTTLFAIGVQMRTAQIQDWEDHITRRGDEIGLDPDETAKIVSNVSRQP